MSLGDNTLLVVAALLVGLMAGAAGGVALSSGTGGADSVQPATTATPAPETAEPTDTPPRDDLRERLERAQRERETLRDALDAKEEDLRRQREEIRNQSLRIHRLEEDLEETRDDLEDCRS